MIKLTGIAASDGIIIGKCHLLDRSKVHVKRTAISLADVPAEVQRFQDAVKKTEQYISKVKELSYETLGKDHAFIFDVYLLLLQDDMLIGETIRSIEKDQVNAEFALQVVRSKVIKIFNSQQDEYFRERKNDVEHVVQKLFRFMTDSDFDSVMNAQEGGVIIAHDLSPSDITQMVQMKIRGFAIDLGSKVSHTSILARSVGIPAVVGLGNITEQITPGDSIIIDGFDGIVYLNPTEEKLAEYREKEQRYQQFVSFLNTLKTEDAVTADGTRVGIFSNIELNEEIGMACSNGSGGIGLYRTEYIYLQHGDVSEEEQFEILKNAVQAVEGDKEITIRTFDLGGEKLSNIMPHPDERNPVMGLRAIRYSLRFEEFFIKQLRAIARVAMYGDVRIMFPMISGLFELNQAKAFLQRAYDELAAEGIPHKNDIPVGVMVELPSLALCLDHIAPEVDFFSVGTNDLIQYTIGIDRNNEYVAYLYRPTHPAVLYLLQKIVDVSGATKTPVTVCGEMAGEPKYIAVLLGLGFRRLSMSPAGLLKAKMIIQRLNIRDCVLLAERLKKCTEAVAAEALLESFIEENASGVYFH